MKISREQMAERLLTAYLEARCKKRKKKSQLRFEFNLGDNLLQLLDELESRTYKVSAGVCFITNDPIKREIYASLFRDRIVHHFLFDMIAPVLGRQFIYDSYSCRLGKGTHFGVKRFAHFLQKVTDNYTKQAYILQLDIKGYFMSIVREKLYHILWQRLNSANPKLRREMDFELIDYLLRAILFRNPVEGVKTIGFPKDWDGLPASKSLLLAPKGVGLPIGDLTSQLFSNVYLGELDNYVKRELKVECYGRYVDDLFLMHPSKEFLKECIGKIETFLREELQLTLHPNKIRLVEAKYGGRFLGAYVLPHRIYIRNRTVARFSNAMTRLERICSSGEFKRKQLECWGYYSGMRPIPIYYKERDFMRSKQRTLIKRITGVINSYTGNMKHYRCQKIISRRLKDSLLRKMFTFDSKYKVSVPDYFNNSF